jgi:hypothetical protein
MIENSFLSKYFTIDHLGVAYPLYAREEKIPCVVLTTDFKPEIRRFSKRVILPRCDFSNVSVEQAEQCAVELLIESARENQNFFSTFGEVINHYSTYDLPFGRILVPNGGDMAERIGKYAILTNFISIDKTNLLNDAAIICPPPEFLGVIAIKDNLYSMGVINSRAICVLT